MTSQITNPGAVTGNAAAETITYAAAINQALALALETDPDVFLLGEDIGSGGGVYKVTKGLYEQFGADRVVDTPISEAEFVGLAAGAAIAGMRPVAELMFVDFALVAGDQLFNQVAKLGYLSGGKLRVPLTVRTQQGISGGGGSQHSQSLETLFAHMPGFAVAMPATPADAKGLLTAAIRMDEPTVFIEHKGLYFTKGQVPTGEHVVPFGVASVRRDGGDITLVSYSRGVHWCLEAAEELSARHGVEATVIDVRTIVPLDIETVAESVARTHAVVVVHESARTAGMGAEIASQLTERCWSDLRAAPRRVAGLDIPVPYSRPLEQRWLPQVQSVVSCVLETVGAGAGALSQ